MVKFRKRIVIYFAFLLGFLIGLYLFNNFANLENNFVINDFNNKIEYPIGALGESPFDSENLLRESEFNTATYWNFTSTNNITSKWNSVDECAQFNHTSPASEKNKVKNDLEFAFLDGADVYDKLRNKGDGQSINVDKKSHLIMKFKGFLEDGDIISLYILDGASGATITIYNEDGTPFGGYGQGYYTGSGPQYVNITLSGLEAPKDIFLVNFSSFYGGNYVRLDYITSDNIFQIPKVFLEKASFNQTISVEKLFNITYTLNFTTVVANFKNISFSILSVYINDTNIWSKQYLSTSLPIEYSIDIPDFVKDGGDYLINFEIQLYLNTVNYCDFKLYVDNIYFWKLPFKNLIRNSEFQTQNFWENSTSDYRFRSYYNIQEENFEFSSYQNQANLFDGWTELNQTFYKNCSNSDFQLIVNYCILNVIGVKSLNLEIYLNTSLIKNETISQISYNWKELRLNVSQYLQIDQFYELGLKFVVIANMSENLLNWTVKMDNIFIYPLWGSQISVIKDFPEKILIGEEVDFKFYYNTSDTGESIKDATIYVYNNDTQKEWGLDFSTSKQYFVNNEGNGNFTINLLTINTEVVAYNLSIFIYARNFPDKTLYRVLNITGESFKFSIVKGGYFNTTYDTWLIYANNTPYVNDTTKYIRIYLQDNKSLQPLTDGFIEANLDKNSLSWSEIYKSSKKLEDRGFYNVYINTQDLNPVNEYLQLNITLTIWIKNYVPFSYNVSTLIKPIPTKLEVADINPVYEESTITVSAAFYDIFHDISINNGKINWMIVGKSEFYGQLDFIFQGFYQKEIDLKGLSPGIYILQFEAEKENHEQATDLKNVEIKAKWNSNVTILYSPNEIFEDNYFSISYNFSIEEKNLPLNDEPIKFNISYWNNSNSSVFTKITDDSGGITIEIFAPPSETKITVRASYKGSSEINGVSINKNVTVIPKYSLNITLLRNEFPNEFIGGSQFEIKAKAIFLHNGTAAVNIPLEFQIGNSRQIEYTNDSGVATAILKLPTSGEFEINVSYSGSNFINIASSIPLSISIISPETVLVQNLKFLVIILAIIAATILTSYICVKKLVIQPNIRKRKAEYLELMKKFEDVRNIQLLIVIDRISGIDLFSKQMSEIPIDPTLISGFLQAISSFGKDIKISTETKKKALQELAFHHFLFVFEEGENVRSALLLLKSPSQEIKNSLSRFTQDVESKFSDFIKEQSGETLDNEILNNMVEENYKISLSYVHELKIQDIDEKSLSKWEKIIIKHFQESQNGYYLDRFIEEFVYVYYNGKELDFLKAILNLKKKRILIPIIPELNKKLK